ncbi:MAG TPA: prepilin-type N-terminal cleavage/methylation domain-containing protein [Candidatus Hydrogenedentes bacterium]|nr:prepilin-type N-terminal cleavage/methylation domain-containing protein [Candidatus Hydrogenedentota bacterium]
MLPTQRDHSGGRRRGQRGGFTLVEVLVALAVMSAATWIIISLFTSSVKLEKNARSMRVAADLARARLADITARPEAYVWPAAEAVTAEQGAPLTLKSEQEASFFAMPAVLPSNPIAANSEKNFYDNFTWEAYVTRPPAGRGYYEILVVVGWQEANRSQQLILTGSIPTAMAKEAS